MFYNHVIIKLLSFLALFSVFITASLIVYFKVIKSGLKNKIF